MTPPAAPEPITHTSYFTAAIPGIILERDLVRVKEPPAAYCPPPTDASDATFIRKGALGSGQRI
jgi:hypothetical protein